MKRNTLNCEHSVVLKLKPLGTIISIIFKYDLNKYIIQQVFKIRCELTSINN